MNTGSAARALMWWMRARGVSLWSLTACSDASSTALAPSEIWAWVGVVFAVVIIGRLGHPLGALLGGMLIGVCESMTMAVVDPAWAPLVSFSVLIALLLFRPRWV